MTAPSMPARAVAICCVQEDPDPSISFSELISTGDCQRLAVSTKNASQDGSHFNVVTFCVLPQGPQNIPREDARGRTTASHSEGGKSRTLQKTPWKPAAFIAARSSTPP